MMHGVGDLDTAGTGRVLTAHSGRYNVFDSDAVVACQARRRLRRPDPSWPRFPVPGDLVEWRRQERSGGSSGIIEAVRPRRSEIARGRGGRKQVVVANLDQLVVVVAVHRPPLDRGLLDRLLATAESNHVPARVCLHKVDLAGAGELEPLRRLYDSLGYPVLCTSAVSGEGIEALRTALQGHISAFMGSSGAGKSRLIAALQPGLELRTGMLSERRGRGRHTTTRVDLHPTDFGALLADTPGVREFGLWDLGAAELRDLFPEFRSLQGSCRFAGCTHDHEPRCAVHASVESGDVDAGRYRSYLAILADLRLKEQERGHRGARRREEDGP
jgi:ribosome biogenesis GTPase